KMFPASTTKIMTALVALESIKRGEHTVEEKITVTKEMLAGLPGDGSNMNLKEEEEISIKELLEGLLIPSGNDAAMALAFTIGGSPEHFVEMMNERANKLGLKGTHFMNPHGLHNEEHYTTARDMSKIAMEAMKLDTFRGVVEIAHIKIPPTNKNPQRYYINTNGLLSTMRYREYYYPKSTGIKTGHTKEAGNCLVASAMNDNFELISVVFNGASVKNSHKDTIRLLDYGFTNFKTVVAVPKGKMMGEVKVKQGAKGVDHVTLSTSDEMKIVVPNDAKKEDIKTNLVIPEKAYAPIELGKVLANASISYKGTELAKVELIADTEVEQEPLGFIMAFGETLWASKIVRIITYVLGLLLIFFIFVGIVRLNREIKRAKRYKKAKKTVR
ncbi:MAG: D-alanyl-D-alanine carboxypeptidase family protein, partial [Oscillospiraceae bacterium]